MWDLPGPGLEPRSPALAGGFFTTKFFNSPSTQSHTALHPKTNRHILSSLLLSRLCPHSVRLLQPLHGDDFCGCQTVPPVRVSPAVLEAWQQGRAPPLLCVNTTLFFCDWTQVSSVDGRKLFLSLNSALKVSTFGIKSGTLLSLLLHFSAP